MAAAVEMKKKLTLSDLAPTEVKAYLVHPKLGKLDAYVSMQGPDSDRFVEVGRAIYKNRGTKSETELNDKEIIQETVDLIAGLATGWSDDELFECEFSTDNLRNILIQHKWVRTTLQAAIEDRKSFFMV